MPRVLILSASYGSGHGEAARSLAGAFERSGATVMIVDHFRELVHPVFERATRALYYWMLRRTPTAWGLAYALGDRIAPDSPLTLGVTRLGAQSLARLLHETTPDAVVTVHATPAVVMSALVARGVRVPPHTTVVTDFVAHSQWMPRHVDRYCVAADEVRNEFVARGISAARIVVTGVPLRPGFSEAVDPLAARRAIGLAADVPVVLAMAGARGALGRLGHVTQAMLRARRPLQGVVVTGRDPELAQTLTRMTAGTTVRVFQYVPDMARLMAAADLLITKAGGMTLAEAMAAELPMLLYGSLPGQERGNERFASRAGIALVARSRAALSDLLERALTGPEELEHLRGVLAATRRPDGSERVVEVVFETRRSL